jgi:hypothetical protein
LVLEGIGDDKVRVNRNALQRRVTSMSVDLAHPAAEKIVLVLEGPPTQAAIWALQPLFGVKRRQTSFARDEARCHINARFSSGKL